ncbi:hypothetical protein Tco_0391100 [Tanacetum coccineum]
MDIVKFKAPPPLTGPAENRNKNKFRKFHGDKGHSIDECIHLRRQIEEAVKSGQLSHLVKEIKQGGKRGEHTKARKKGEAPNKEKATAIFMWTEDQPQKSLSPYNGIIGRPSLRKIQAVPSTAHGMLKFPLKGGISTIRSTAIIPVECRMVAEAHDTSLPREPVVTKRIKVAIHPYYPDQTVMIDGSLSEKRKMELCNLLKENLDIFAWKPADMAGVPRSIAKHR